MQASGRTSEDGVENLMVYPAPSPHGQRVQSYQ